MPSNLTERLRALHVDQLVRAAEAIRDWPACEERLEHARCQIREAMYLCAIGRISQVEESRVFSILCFAMPEPDATFDADERPR